MPYISFAYDSTALVNALGYERANDYLLLAKATTQRARIVRYYALILLAVSALLFIFIGVAFQNRVSSEGVQFFNNPRLWALLLSVVPFTILGAYLGYRAHRVLFAAKHQVKMFESSLEYAARKDYG